MKFQRIMFELVIATLLMSAKAYSQAGKSEKSPSSPSAQSVEPFLGRWDLTLKAPDREYPSWLELRLEGGQLKAQMVSRWGNARPLPKVELSNGRLTFVSPKEEEDRAEDMVFALKVKSLPKWGKPIQLFNGKDMSGWRMDGADTSVWKVVDGNLVSPGNGPELINDSKFGDFKLHVEFNCAANSNSGIYLRGRYEVQIETDSIEEPPSHHMGGVYGFLAPSPELPREPGEWQSFDITLIGRWITVVQNGQTIIDNKEIPGITGGALDSYEELPGPLYLQGSEKGHVAYRSIVVTPAEK